MSEFPFPSVSNVNVDTALYNTLWGLYQTAYLGANKCETILMKNDFDMHFHMKSFALGAQQNSEMAYSIDGMTNFCLNAKYPHLLVLSSDNRSCDTFLPHIFQFLVLLSYECFQPKFNQAKAIVGMPRIIQLCDGIMAGGQPAQTHGICLQ